MRHRALVTVTCCCSLVSALGLGLAPTADGSPRIMAGGGDLTQLGGPVGAHTAPKAGPHAGAHGSTVAVDAHGVLVVERNAGMLVRADRQGNPVATLALHQGMGELVHDGAGRVFVADRTADRVVQVAPGDGTGKGLAVTRSFEIAEPHGLALTPDGSTLLITSVADKQLVAVDTKRLAVKWRVALAPEPRGVAVSADGTRAVVGFLSSGSLAIVELASEGARVQWQALDPRDHIAIEEEHEDEDGFVDASVQIREARSRFQVPTDTGRRHARNVFAVGFVGDGMVVAPHELATPQMRREVQQEREDSYGGGVVSIPPIVHRLARVDDAGTQTSRVAFTSLGVHQPRALSYDLPGDVLYVAGYGDDVVLAVHDASQSLPYVRWQADVGDRDDACGIDGVVADGDALWVHCELSRKLLRIDTDAIDLHGSVATVAEGGVSEGPQLAESLRSPLVEHGAELFRRSGDFRLSDNGDLACASCHPEGRADGLTWRLGQSILQTPMLAGRIEGTAPYKWDGQDEDLSASLHHTVGRLGGFPESLRRRDFEALAAYLQSMSPPRTPTVTDADAVARGQALFASADLGCADCHSGSVFTDGQQYPLDTRLDTTDTPSLVGLAHSAPYYHDGSAIDLRALLTDKGTVHEMADLSGLSPQQVDDLEAFLETL